MAIPVYRPPSPFTAMYWIWMTMHRFSIRWAIPMKFSKISPSAKMLLLWAPPTWIQVRNWILHFFWCDFELKNSVQIQCRCMPILAYRWGLVLFCVEFTYFVDRNHTFDISRFDFTCCTIYYTNIDTQYCNVCKWNHAHDFVVGIRCCSRACRFLSPLCFVLFHLVLSQTRSKFLCNKMGAARGRMGENNKKTLKVEWAIEVNWFEWIDTNRKKMLKKRNKYATQASKQRIHRASIVSMCILSACLWPFSIEFLQIVTSHKRTQGNCTKVLFADDSIWINRRFFGFWN